jgi:hypothetical protein
MLNLLKTIEKKYNVINKIFILKIKIIIFFNLIS